MKRMLTSKLIAKIKALFTSLWTDDQGNVEVGKNLTVEGNTIGSAPYRVSGETFSDGTIDQDIALSNLPTGLTSYYAHARVSNGTLSIVLAFTGQNIASSNSQLIGSLNLPSNILNMLHAPFSDFIDSKVIVGGYAIPNPNEIYYLEFNLIKTSTGITFLLLNSAIAASTLNYYRAEFNFILS